ncbi:PREDICTED: pescadillo homolog [Amphimedon queenslandica]|uniref:Pescadillo homolog n=1 Tax=Amphimedon queenslandica TaxID=400682 RepID=A0A1X7TDE3_AMPQE|nr:PREDICTED: pescadillo homolog [Amphimedon queenslandica]|eukprot:XP_019860259.1 PREDICTED: pescadillo homolog [Amphimedon queenslandica]
MGREKKKGESGLATTYYSRSQAMRKLQISMPEFRRLCIFKGIYPQEPRHRRKVSKGSSVYKTYYYRKDIAWLAHEPLLQKGRDFKIFVKKLKRAFNDDDKVKIASLEEHRPLYTLDRMVKERYPTFVDALRDIDDVLTMVSLYSTLSSLKIKASVSQLCKRLLLEFMHYVIASKSLRKVFISIKGIYYQAEIQGQTITWLTPHQFPQRIPREVDFRIMNTFVEFYTTLLTFVNFRLFHSLNLRYPPQLEGYFSTELSLQLPSLLVNPNEVEYENDGDKGEYRELLESLSHSLVKIPETPTADTDDLTEEDIPTDLDPEEQAHRDKAREEREKLDEFKTLFEGLKFFLSREVPKESLTFIIKCFGGSVSWDPFCGRGSTYPESDEHITHEIVDRLSMNHFYLSRVYIQPQWVYDSINFRKLLPTDKYSPQASLPPHLSPFTRDGEGDYIPPDKMMLAEDKTEEQEEEEEGEEEDEDLEEREEEEEDLEEREDEGEGEEDEDVEALKPPSPKRRKLPIVPAINLPVGSVVEGDGESEEKDEETQRMEAEAKQEREERKLAVMMMTRTRRKLYDRIMEKRNKKSRRVRELKEKREEYNKEMKKQKSSTK